MPTIQEIKRHYGEEQTKLINESFALGASAQHFEGSMSPEVSERLGPQESERVRIAESHLWADGERDRLRTKYEELDLEKRAAIEVRVEQIEEELRPKEAGFKDFAAAASATPEALITAMDMALGAGNEDAALVAFAAARQRDLEEVVSHATTINERWSDLYAELAEAANDPELDPGDRFEMFAQKLSNILDAPPTDRNTFGMMR